METDGARYFDRDGTPLTTREWAVKFERDDYRRIAFDRFESGVEVSTVWLGLDHNHLAAIFPDADQRPLIFETMVFYPLDEPIEVFGRTIGSEGSEMWRWSSEAEAIAGHDQVVAALRVPDRPPRSR